MNILHVITGLDFGGAERLLLDICEELTNRGKRVYVIYLKSNGDLVDKFMEFGIKVVKIDINKNNIFKCIYKIVSFIKANNIGIIHLHLIHACLIGMISSLFVKPRKVFITLHSTDDWRKVSSISTNIIRLIDKTLFNYSKNTHAVAISHAVKDFFINREGYNTDKISIIHNATKIKGCNNENNSISRKEIGVLDNDYLIVNVGRVEPQKSQITLVKAIEYLVKNKNISNIKCLVIGDGSLYNDLDQYIISHNLERNIYLLGSKYNVNEYLVLADLFAMPSVVEGFGIAILEAYDSGIPVIATSVDGIKEVVDDGLTGVLVESNNHLALANGIMRFYKNDIDKSKLVINAKAKLYSKFSIKTYCDKLLELYIR